ncbi:MAG: hypothetical protein AAF202_02305 [Pseudomonadota bacterium]
MTRRLGLSLLIAMISQSALSQETISQDISRKITMAEEAALNKKLEDGWHAKLNLGANISFGSSSNVIGQPDGDSRTFGANLDSSVIYKKGQNEWQNTLKYIGATSATPAIPRYVKSNDELNFSSLYLYSLEDMEWLGPYVRVQARTAAFRGEDIRPEETNYEISDSQGEVKSTKQGLTTFQLTEAFKPLTVQESVGAFFRLVNEKKIKVKTRLGLGAQQVDGSGQLTLADKSETADVVEVRELATYQQMGVEGGLQVDGKIDEKSSYSLTFDFLTPVGADLPEGDDRDDLELTNMDLKIKLTSKVYEWVSFNYEFNLREQPQLLDETQITHLMSMSFAYEMF